MFKATKKPRETNLNTLGEGVIYGKGFSMDQLPGEVQDDSGAFVTISISDSRKVQFCIRESRSVNGLIRLYYRFIINGEVTEWEKMVGDSGELNNQLDNQLAQKEQVFESTRNTVNIHHGENGTDEKTTVDTNPQKVLEHENLISDSEYITLDHETDVNKTHIKTESLKQELQQLHQTKQDTLTAGDGITIQGQTISASGFSTSTIKNFLGTNFLAYSHRVQASGGEVLTTFSFECYDSAETEITGELKENLASYVEPTRSVSNGALSITNDGTTMKLINSAPSGDVTQHATFTFGLYSA